MAARTHTFWFGAPTRRTNHFYPLLRNPFFLPQTLKMVTAQANSKRPTCPSCYKPTRVCLCSRIQNPGLHNSVSVTILQHSLEKNHPLNSARIARLGLKNLNVVTVYDVNFEARFVIRSPGPASETGSDPNGWEGSGFDQVEESREAQKMDSECCDEVGDLEFGLPAHFAMEKNNSSSIDSDEKCDFESDAGDASNAPNRLGGGVDFVSDCGLAISDVVVVEQECGFTSGNEVSPATTFDAESKISNVGSDSVGSVESDNGGAVITASIDRYGVISSLSCIWRTQAHCKNSEFATILDIAGARDALAEGFVVRKLKRKPLEGSVELDECLEFELDVPPGSVLLFPSEEAVGAGDLEAMNAEVKNLIVLDGTWAKARRMYVENPWLKLLPHLKLDLDKASLYNEVRQQPKPGCLSTIESIVYALKAVGDSPEGLDNLLDVFESMVEDQIRCKEERLSNVSPG